MELSKLLEKQRPAILKTWLREIFDAYPVGTSRFLKGEQDMFANPVGHNIAVNAEYLLNGLIRKDSDASMSSYLEQIIRIRAVQDFTPSQAVSFMDSLKPVIISKLKTEITKYSLGAEWGELETRIDSLAQCAYELYEEMKQRIDIIRTKEMDKSERFVKRLMENRTK